MDITALFDEFNKLSPVIQNNYISFAKLKEQLINLYY